MARHSFNVELAQSFGPAINDMESIQASLTNAINAAQEVAKFTGNEKLMKLVENQQAATDALKRTFAETIESAQVVARQYEGLQEL